MSYCINNTFSYDCPGNFISSIYPIGFASVACSQADFRKHEVNRIVCHFKNSTSEFLIIGNWLTDIVTMEMCTLNGGCWEKVLWIFSECQYCTIGQFTVTH